MKRDIVICCLILTAAIICCGSMYSASQGRSIRLPAAEHFGSELYAEWLERDTDNARREFDAAIRANQ